MGFETPQYLLSDFLKWTSSGQLQLPDFQREYKWEDERIRQLLVTVLRGHPMGAVMLLETGNDQVRFKPKTITGSSAPDTATPRWLLLDGQQRLTSLTQALTGNGVVRTTDSRGKMVERKYFIDLDVALDGDDRIDEAVLSLPGDGIERTDFGRVTVRDLSTTELQQQARIFPISLLFSGYSSSTWMFGMQDNETAEAFTERVLSPASGYQIPAIQLDKETSKAAVATVFEKVNTGGVPLNVFELLTATFAGDGNYFTEHGEDFRLNDDWHAIADQFRDLAVMHALRNTDFLQALTLLTTRKRNLASTADRKPPVSARREDVLKLQLTDYLEWRDELVEAFRWADRFLSDLRILDSNFLPYASQLVPLAVLKVILGRDADALGVHKKIQQWYWCGVLGELYGSTTETRMAKDIEQVPAWALGTTEVIPNTIIDANFAESRLFSLRTRRSAAYRGIYALQISEGARDWVRNQQFDLRTHKDLATDIHHIFPQQWAIENDVDRAYYDSIVNKTPLAAETNRAIGGVAPSQYLMRVESNSRLTPEEVDGILATHGINTTALRADDFYTHFESRKEWILTAIEGAMGKRVQRDVLDNDGVEMASEFEVGDDLEV